MRRSSSRSPRYAELRCKTNFSFLCGASHPDELVMQAAALGYDALAITDQNTLAGIVRAHMAAKAEGLKLLFGSEVTVEDAPAVLLYAPDRQAYGRLARLITRGRRAAEKGSCLIHFSDVAEHAEGLLAAVIPSRSTPAADELDRLSRYREVFIDRCYLAASLHHGPHDDAELERLATLARQLRMPLVAAYDVHYHDPNRRPLQDVLTAIRLGVTVAQLGEQRFPNGERYLQSPHAMAQRFARQPAAIANGLELAERCTFSLDELRYQYPEELCPPSLTAAQHLARLTWDGARVRYAGGVPAKVTALLTRELNLIEELHYEPFFLTVWDLVQFARSRDILCQGRGSAANSAVCFCLGITSVDPDHTDVLFERFVSRERDEAPDIDVDFEHERREEVLQYVYEKYGRDRAGIAAEVITYRPRSAVRDVGKALGLSLDRIDRLAGAFDQFDTAADLNARLADAGLAPGSSKVGQLLHLVREILGFPRHLSQHVGGFVITQGPLSELVPIENAAMPDRTVIEWDKDDLDALGMLKVDCLALGMLTAIRKCFQLIEKHHGVTLTLANVPAEDPIVYDMICRADTIGVFQIESRAQMSMLPRLRPRSFYDLVIEVAIVRPGPIQGNMVHPYLRRRNGTEPVTYPDKAVEEVLSKTLGVPLFQEQVMRLAMVAAGFTAGEADQLRRAMGAWRRVGVMEKFHARLRDGMAARGLPAPFAEQLIEQIQGFGEYGFPESHAASFALLAYISAWLKCHYPAAFAAALLNSQPMGFYAPAQIIGDVKNHGVTVHPVDVNLSDWDCTLDGGTTVSRDAQRSAEAAPALRCASRLTGFAQPDLRLGFRLIKGFPQAAAAALCQARGDRPFHSIQDLARRAGLGRPLLARLAAADAFGSLKLGQRPAFWQALQPYDTLPLFADLDDEADPPELPELALGEQIIADYDATGLSLKAHPMSLLRAELDRAGIVQARSLWEVKDKATVQVAGLVIGRQQPATAKGTIFITLEDETGIVNLIVWRSVWEKYRKIAAGAVALLVEGEMQRTAEICHVCAAHMEDLSHHLRNLTVTSRDFR
jgi:error-prone DNA polymerase